MVVPPPDTPHTGQHPYAPQAPSRALNRASTRDRLLKDREHLPFQRRLLASSLLHHRFGVHSPKRPSVRIGIVRNDHRSGSRAVRIAGSRGIARDGYICTALVMPEMLMPRAKSLVRRTSPFAMAYAIAAVAACACPPPS